MVRTVIWPCHLTGGLCDVDLVGHAQLAPLGDAPGIEPERDERGAPSARSAGTRLPLFVDDDSPPPPAGSFTLRRVDD
jgi:hypothetical protein